MKLVFFADRTTGLLKSFPTEPVLPLFLYKNNSHPQFPALGDPSNMKARNSMSKEVDNLTCVTLLSSLLISSASSFLSPAHVQYLLALIQFPPCG